MLLDKNLLFTENGSTGNTGTNTVGDVIDLKVASLDVGAGQPVYLNVVVTTGITAASAGTYQIKLVSGTDTAVSAGTTDHITSASFTTGTTAIAAGTVLVSAALPSGTYGRYLAVKEVVGSQNTTAGKITAFLSKNQPAYKAYDGAQ